MTGTILPQIKGHLTMQRNAKYAKNSKKSAFLQILWVSLQKYRPLPVPRKHFCHSSEFCIRLYIRKL